MNWKSKLIKLVTFLGGIYFFLEFFLPKKIGDFELGAWNDQISVGFIAISSMAVGLGLINIFMVHGTKIIFKKKDWFYSLTLLGGFLIMLSVTSLDWYQSAKLSASAERFNMLSAYAQKLALGSNPDVALLKQEIEQSYAQAQLKLEGTSFNDKENAVKFDRLKADFLDKSGRLKEMSFHIPAEIGEVSVVLDQSASIYREALMMIYDQSLVKSFYNFLYQGLFVSLGSAMFALLAFYVASAAFRAFRIRSFESALMMIAAVLVMLGQIPFGLWISEDLPHIRLWLLEVPNSAAFRAIAIGSGVAGFIMAFRMWISLETDKFNE